MKKCLILIFTVSFFSLTGCAWFFESGGGLATWSGDLRGTSWERTTYDGSYVKITAQKKAQPTDPTQITKENLYLTTCCEKFTISKTLNEAGYYTATLSSTSAIHTIPESFKDIETDSAEISYTLPLGTSFLFNTEVHIDKIHRYEGFSKGIPCQDEVVEVWDLMITKDKIGQYFYHFYGKGRITKTLHTNDGLKEETDSYTITDSSKFTYEILKEFKDKTGETPDVTLSPSRKSTSHSSEYCIYKKGREEFLILGDMESTPYKKVKK